MFLQMYTIVFAQIRIHQTSAPPCSAAPYCACAEPPRRHQCMHRPAHVLTNSLHERELVQFVASLLNSEKQRKVLSGCLEKFTHGWSLGYSDLPSGKSEYPWDHPRVNFSRQPLRTFRYLYQRPNLTILNMDYFQNWRFSKSQGLIIYGLFLNLENLNTYLF